MHVVAVGVVVVRYYGEKVRPEWDSLIYIMEYIVVLWPYFGCCASLGNTNGAPNTADSPARR